MALTWMTEQPRRFEITRTEINDYLEGRLPFTELPRHLTDAQTEISYTFFALDTAVLLLIIGGASLLTVWYFWARPWDRSASVSRLAGGGPEH